MLLISDIGSNYLFVQAHRGYEVAPGPEYLPCEIPLPATELPSDRDRTFALHIPHYVRNRILGRNAYAHLYVFGPQMPFNYLGLFVLR